MRINDSRGMNVPPMGRHPPGPGRSLLPPAAVAASGRDGSDVRAGLRQPAAAAARPESGPQRTANAGSSLPGPAADGNRRATRADAASVRGLDVTPGAERVTPWRWNPHLDAAALGDLFARMVGEGARVGTRIDAFA